MKWARLRRTVAIAVKEMRQLARDRMTLGMIVGLPAMQILLFGYGINYDVRHIPIGVADLANTQFSRALIADLQATQVVDVGFGYPQRREFGAAGGRQRVGDLLVEARLHDADAQALAVQRPGRTLVCLKHQCPPGRPKGTERSLGGQRTK